MATYFSLPANKLQVLYLAHNEWPFRQNAHMIKTAPFIELGKRLNVALEAAGYTKTRYKNLTVVLSKLFAVEGSTVSDWRNGKKCPTMENAILIGEKLDVCVEWLLTGRGPMHPPPQEDDGGTYLDISQLPKGQQVHLKALVHAIQEQVTTYQQGTQPLNGTP